MFKHGKEYGIPPHLPFTSVVIYMHMHLQMCTLTHTHLTHSSLDTTIDRSAMIHVKLMLFGGQVIENFTSIGFILTLIRI